MNIYTVIPARGGSKSIPKKNIQLLNGKPLVYYSIRYSLNCPLVKHTVVSTDSEEIAGIARKYKAEIPFMRPVGLAKDDVQDYPVFKHALEELESYYKEVIDILVLLRPTSPLRPGGLIEKGVALLKRFPEATSVRTVMLSSEHPYRQWLVTGDYMSGYERGVYEPYNIPRQKLPLAYFQTGDLELVRRSTILDGSISGSRVLPLIIERKDKLDIDSMFDLKEAKSRIKKGKR